MATEITTTSAVQAPCAIPALPDAMPPGDSSLAIVLGMTLFAQLVLPQKQA